MSAAVRGPRDGRSPTRRTFVIDAFPDGAFRHLERDAIVCIDVMESSTTLVTAVVQGRRALVAASAPEAAAIGARLDRPLLAGARVPAGPWFEIEDSPSSLDPSRFETARPLVLFSPPGTELLVNAGAAPDVLVACFRNLAATAAHLAARFRHVALLTAGYRDEVSSEDLMAAARIAADLERRGFQAGDLRTSDITRRWSTVEASLAGWGNSAARLRDRGRMEDLEMILARVDDVALACAYRDGEVVNASAMAREGERAPSPREDGVAVTAAGDGGGNGGPRA
jgi:phosphosulfolactate phosphohydrolase-like enzyme